MNALNTARSFMVLLLDESGPLDSFWSSGDLTTDAMIQLARTMWLTRDLTTVLTAEWATKPAVGLGREFHVTIPGTHEVKAPAPKKKRARRVETDWDDSELLDGPARPIHLSRLFGVHMGAPVPVDTSVEVVAKCCGISHTRGSFGALEMVSVNERTQGDVVLHDEARLCGCCKAVLAITTTRLVRR